MNESQLNITLANTKSQDFQLLQPKTSCKTLYITSYAVNLKRNIKDFWSLFKICLKIILEKETQGPKTDEVHIEGHYGQINPTVKVYSGKLLVNDHFECVYIHIQSMFYEFNLRSNS